MENFRALVIRGITPQVSPMVYLMMFMSIFIGFCFMTGFLVGGGESLLFSSDHIIPVTWWGGILFGSASVCEYALATKNWHLISVAGIGTFSMWLLASLDLLLGGHIYALVVLALFHLMFQTYVYLAASLGVLQREAVNR